MTEYYECDCGCTILRVEYDEDIGEFFFSTYRGKEDKLPWRYRIQSIIQIIRNGEPYGDEVVLNKDTAKRLVNYIKKKIDVIEMKKKCKACLGYGFWAWGHIAPMGPMDAEDGVHTIKCPECGENPNPIESDKILKDREETIYKIYIEGKLKFGTAKNSDEFKEIWRQVNEDDN